MKMVHVKSLICSGRHCFDLSKHGYVNFLTHPLKTKYDKMMFESRRMICESGWFKPLDVTISERIVDCGKPKTDYIRVLDAGCGEGSHLSEIRRLTQDSTMKLLGAAIDISKEGVCIASREYPDNIWCVGDVANLPFANQQFNFIVNILSPSNYAEFRRVLSDDGMVIKVIPGNDYLRELRTFFYRKTAKSVDSNEDTLDLFRRNLSLVNMENVRYSFSLGSTQVATIVNMTPLSWGATEGHMQKILEMNLENITIDLTVLVGKKK